MKDIDQFCPLLGKKAGKMMGPYLPTPEPETEYNTEPLDTFHHYVRGNIIIFYKIIIACIQLFV